MIGQHDSPSKGAERLPNDGDPLPVSARVCRFRRHENEGVTRRDHRPSGCPPRVRRSDECNTPVRRTKVPRGGRHPVNPPRYGVRIKRTDSRLETTASGLNTTEATNWAGGRTDTAPRESTISPLVRAVEKQPHNWPVSRSTGSRAKPNPGLTARKNGFPTEVSETRVST